MPNTLQTIMPRVQYVADGIQNDFEFNFTIFKKQYLKVYLNETQVPSSSYVISLHKTQKQGTVHFKTIPTAGTIITLYRAIDIERITDFQEGGVLRASALNDELDYQNACIQQVAEQVSRGMILPPHISLEGADLTLPAPVPGKSIVWSQDGKSLENSSVEINALSDAFDAQVENATAQADRAMQQAQIAQTKAELATAEAQIATNQATVAAEQAAISTQKANEAAQLTGDKANIDMDNISNAGKKNLSALMVPDFDAIVNISSLNQYQAPCDGYIYMHGQTVAWDLYAADNTTAIQIEYYLAQDWAATMMPIAKGQWYRYRSGSARKFIPLKGAI